MIRPVSLPALLLSAVGCAHLNAVPAGLPDASPPPSPPDRVSVGAGSFYARLDYAGPGAAEAQDRLTEMAKAEPGLKTSIQYRQPDIAPAHLAPEGQGTRVVIEASRFRLVRAYLHDPLGARLDWLEMLCPAEGCELKLRPGTWVIGASPAPFTDNVGLFALAVDDRPLNLRLTPRPLDGGDTMVVTGVAMVIVSAVAGLALCAGAEATAQTTVLGQSPHGLTPPAIGCIVSLVPLAVGGALALTGSSLHSMPAAGSGTFRVGPGLDLTVSAGK